MLTANEIMTSDCCWATHQHSLRPVFQSNAVEKSVPSLPFIWELWVSFFLFGLSAAKQHAKMKKIWIEIAK